MSHSTSAPILQAALVDLIDLSLVGKQAHWNVRGPHFRSVHLELDEIIDLVRVNADDVAERMRALDAFPDGRAAAVAQTSKLEDIGTGELADDKVVAQFTTLLTDVAARIESDLPSLDEDLPSQDLLIGIVTGLNKAAWMMRMQNK